VAQVDEGHEGAGASAPQVLTFGSPTIGEILAERYQLEEHVGTDSLGRQLYRGMDVVLRRPVAVVLHYPGGDAAGEMLAGAVAASRIVHPHLVGVYDAIDEDERAYVVREWVDGSSLRQLLANGPLDPARAIGIGWAVTDAVAALHATGMVHGNVHPGSVMVAHDGRVVLTDARADEAATPDSDIRAVGAVLYCALTAHWPYAEVGPDLLPDAVRDNAGALAAPRQVRAGIPAHLDELIVDLLNTDVPAPPADVLASELARFDQAARGSFFDAEGSLDLDAFDHSTVRSEGHPGPGRRKVAAVAGGLVAVVLAGSFAIAKMLPDGGGTTAAPELSPSVTSVPAKPPSPGKPTALTIAANQVRIVDPPQGDRAEIGNAARTVDGDPKTVWSTSHYKAAKFGNRKPGMGVLLDLGEARTVVGVRVEIAQRGATIELRGGDTDPGATSAGDAQIVASYRTLDGPKPEVGATIVLKGSEEPVRYLLVWVTVLPPDAGEYQIGIKDISVNVQ